MTVENTVPEIPVSEIPEGAVLRFFWHGNVSHIVFPNEPLPPGREEARRHALCGAHPYWPAVWFGDEEGYAFKSSDYGDKRATDLPICTRCMRRTVRGTEGERPA